MIILKDSVDVAGIQPEITLAISIADGVFGRNKLNCIVTSVLDSEHRPDSLHYEGLACDLRIWHIPVLTDDSLVDRIVRSLKGALGPQYDVVLESDHIHVEFDPR